MPVLPLAPGTAPGRSAGFAVESVPVVPVPFSMTLPVFPSRRPVALRSFVPVPFMLESPVPGSEVAAPVPGVLPPAPGMEIDPPVPEVVPPAPLVPGVVPVAPGGIPVVPLVVPGPFRSMSFRSCRPTSRRCPGQCRSCRPRPSLFRSMAYRCPPPHRSRSNRPRRYCRRRHRRRFRAYRLGRMPLRKRRRARTRNKPIEISS